jgi:hypothetical protein
MTNLQRSSPIRFVVWKFVVLMLSCLLLIQYMHNRSLWNDEAMLALNITGRGFSGLLRPLDDYQVAPVLFLLIEKLFTTLFGNTEPALRIFPLLCALASLPVFYMLCLQLTGNRVLSLCALILLGCTPKFIYYSSELKQYATDMLLLLIIYYTAFIHSAFLNKWRGLALSVVGGIAIFISNVSIIPLCVIGLLFMNDLRQTKKIRTGHWVPVITWIFFISINYLLFIRNHPHTQFMKSYWKNSFMPLNFSGTPFRKWMDKSIMQVFRDLLPSLPWGYLFIATAMLYASSLALMLWKKEFRLFYLCVAPVAIHLLLSAMKIYPFELRLILYQAPLYIMVMAYGIWHLSQALSKRQFLRSMTLTVITALLIFRLFLEFPIDHDELRPAIQYINQYSQPGESLYVLLGSIPATRYYIRTGLAKFDALQIIWGQQRKISSASYLNELSKINGHVWLLISHMYPFNGNREEEREVVHALQKRGMLLRQCEFHGSSAYQFDLR